MQHLQSQPIVIVSSEFVRVTAAYEHPLRRLGTRSAADVFASMSVAINLELPTWKRVDDHD
jgi:hypothetical protein